MDLKKLLKTDIIVPLVIIIGLLVALLFSMHASATLGAGVTLYEHNARGFQPVYTTPAPTRVGVGKYHLGFYRVTLRNRSVSLWAPATYFSTLQGFPGALLARVSGARLDAEQPPFKARQVRATYAARVKGRTMNITVQTTETYILLLPLLLVVVLLVARKQVLKNTAMLLLLLMLLLYCLYAAGLVKSSTGFALRADPALLDNVKSSLGTVLYCQNIETMRFVHAHLGGRVRVVVSNYVPPRAKGYALWRGAPGAGWRQIKVQGGLGLYLKLQ